MGRFVSGLMEAFIRCGLIVQLLFSLPGNGGSLSSSVKKSSIELYRIARVLFVMRSVVRVTFCCFQ